MRRPSFFRWLKLITFFSAALITLSCENAADVTNRSGVSNRETKQTNDGTEVTSTDENGTSNVKIFIPTDSEIDANGLSIGDGATIANSTTATYLNYHGDILSTGKSVSVSFSNSEAEAGAGSLMISLPIPESPTALAQSGQLVAFYHVKKIGAGVVIYGLIPQSAMIVDDDNASFQYRGIGNYQLAWVTLALAEEVDAETEDIPTFKDGKVIFDVSTITSSSGEGSDDSDGTTSQTGGSKLTCPANWIKVPVDPSAEVNTPEFCVMKFEAKSLQGRAVSSGSGLDFVGVSRGSLRTTEFSAWKACSDLGSNYDLISNAQWQAIARNIETALSPSGAYLNWSNGSTTGDNFINRGHSDGSYPQSPFASTDNDPCYGTFNDYCATNSHSDFTQKRTHILSNGEVIWDFAGRLDEWVKDNSAFNYVYSGSENFWPFIAANTGNACVAPGCLGPQGKPKAAFGPKGDYSTKDTGEYGGFGKANVQGANGTIHRGGGSGHGIMSGIYAVDTNLAATGHSDLGIGFRCVMNSN